MATRAELQALLKDHDADTLERAAKVWARRRATSDSRSMAREMKAEAKTLRSEAEALRGPQ